MMYPLLLSVVSKNAFLRPPQKIWALILMYVDYASNWSCAFFTRI